MDLGRFGEREAIGSPCALADGATCCGRVYAGEVGGRPTALCGYHFVTVQSTVAGRPMNHLQRRLMALSLAELEAVEELVKRAHRSVPRQGWQRLENPWGVSVEMRHRLLPVPHWEYRLNGARADYNRVVGFLSVESAFRAAVGESEA